MQKWEWCWLTRNKKTTFDIVESVGKRTATSRGFVGKVLKDCIKVGYIMLLNNIYWRYPTIISKIKSHTPFGRPLKQQQTIKCGLDDGSCQDDWKQARGTIRKANWLPLIFFDPTNQWNCDRLPFNSPDFYLLILPLVLRDGGFAEVCLTSKFKTPGDKTLTIRIVEMLLVLLFDRTKEVGPFLVEIFQRGNDVSRTGEGLDENIKDSNYLWKH